MKAEPLFERIFVLVDEDVSTSPSGLTIPRDSKDILATGKVIKVGTRMPENSVVEGQKIVFQRHAGVDITVDGTTVRMMMTNDVFARYPLQ